MNAPKSLDSLFKEKLFRIPDYQRGYAWQLNQLTAFWEDLVNLPDARSHYTGVLTLKAIPNNEVKPNSKEFWLVDDHGYQLYHIVDGQQRLTTFVILLQAFVDFVKQLPEHIDLEDREVYITDSLTVADVVEKYLLKVKPRGDQFRTYKFGYEEDNPSDEYLRYRILNEDGPGTVSETFYTLNLGNAKTYFYEQIKQMHADEGMNGLHSAYRKLTKKFLFNEYVIKDEFDVFVAFETMNNRGKKLSDLELLKNRLIYLTTLYDENELDESERQSLRDTINDAWKEVYFQLGRNKAKPLNDDDFLKAHWTMYFKYSRQKGNDYIRFLLDEQFAPQKIHKKIVRQVPLDEIEEQRDTIEIDEDENEEADNFEAETREVRSALLLPTEIRDYVVSLKTSSVHWFNSFYPDLASELTDEEKTWVDRLNRGGMVYFRPLIMAILKNELPTEQRVSAFKKIERFVFIAFRLTNTRSNYRSSEFYNAARAVDQKEMSLDDLETRLEERLSFAFDEEDGRLNCWDLHGILKKKFERGAGWYGWSALRYFLYEYELSLLNQTRQKKVDWEDLLKTAKDRISIEHVYPQTENDGWTEPFQGYDEQWKERYRGCLGNLLLLSGSINSSLQNDSFADKKRPKTNSEGVKIRNGYSDGSHSEIEISGNESWGPTEIQERGVHLLKFMEKRWQFKFTDAYEWDELLLMEIDPKEQGDTAGHDRDDTAEISAE